MVSYEVMATSKSTVQVNYDMLKPLRERMEHVIEKLKTAAEPDPVLERRDGDKYSHPRSRPRHRPTHDPVKRDKRNRMARASRQKNRR
jgi:hypothetical protein